MRLIFIRHGEPNYTDDTLTEKGWREAAHLANRFETWQVTDIFCSPLGRAKDTASLSLNLTGRTAKTLDWLREVPARVPDIVTGEDRILWDMLPQYWTNQPLLYDKDKWLTLPLMDNDSVKKSVSDVYNGIDELLEQYGYRRKDNYYIAERSNKDTLVFFCHFGVSMLILSHLLGISPIVLWQGAFVAPTGITVCATEERADRTAYFRCQVIGDTTHLHDGNEPVSASGLFKEAF